MEELRLWAARDTDARVVFVCGVAADDAGAKNFVLEITVEPDTSSSGSGSGGPGGSARAPSIVEIRARNDGRLFTSEDWHRLATIAEGNPDESTVGMFGVGFYSVFSLTEEPIITSGARYTIFTWQGNQLTTYAAELSKSQQTPATAKETSTFKSLSHPLTPARSVTADRLRAAV